MKNPGNGAVYRSITPLRVSFIGGGTDLPAFYREHGGEVVSMALGYHINIAVRRLDGPFRVAYQVNGEPPRVSPSVDEVEHPITREALKFLEVDKPIEITSSSEVPAGTGLGSSSSYTVGLLHALHAAQGGGPPWARLADEACHIEIDRLKAPIGRQDQYIAAGGGFRRTVFMPDDSVHSTSIECAPDIREEFTNHLMMFYLGGKRPALEILTEVQREMNQNKAPLCELKSMCSGFLESLSRGDFEEVGEILHQAWLIKRSLNPRISNGHVDEAYERSRASGAIGGKLLGAGGTGFLLLLAPPSRHARIRAELRAHREFRFQPDPLGSRVFSE